MLIALYVFLAMGVMDTFAALKVDTLDRKDLGKWRRRLIAGGCEAGNDLGGIFSYGLGGASMLRYGESITTVVILSALCIASVLGTSLGDEVNCRLTSKRSQTVLN